MTDTITAFYILGATATFVYFLWRASDELPIYSFRAIYAATLLWPIVWIIGLVKGMQELYE